MEVFQRALDNPNIKRRIWMAANGAPLDAGRLLHGRRVKTYNIQKKMFGITNERTALFVMDNLINVPSFEMHGDLIRACVEKAVASKPGLYLEFGVFQGSTINLISSLVGEDVLVHGFDSFAGLPENWVGGKGKGAFSTKGAVPKVNDNVRLHGGWFDQSLPEFLKSTEEDVAFLHIDSDIYSSAKTVLSQLKPRISKGTVILFDEFFNYPGYEHHEYKAFFEFIDETKRDYRFIGYNANLFQAAVEIL